MSKTDTTTEDERCTAEKYTETGKYDGAIDALAYEMAEIIENKEFRSLDNGRLRLSWRSSYIEMARGRRQLLKTGNPISVANITVYTDDCDSWPDISHAGTE